MTICLTRLDAEQAVCAQVLPLHYNALPPHSLAVHLAKDLWNQMGLQVTKRMYL